MDKELELKITEYEGYDSPLECFRAHLEYKGLSRMGLSRVNHRLYFKLLDCGQMEEAIPNIVRYRGGGRLGIPKEIANEIVKYFLTHKNNASQTGKKFGRSRYAVIYLCRGKGLKIRGKGRPKENE